MIKAVLSFSLLFFSYNHPMVNEECSRKTGEPPTENLLANAPKENLWINVFDMHDPHTISPDHNETITQLLTACTYGSIRIDEKNIDLRRFFFERLCKKAINQGKSKIYDSQGVQEAWQQCASEWDGVVSAIELFQPKVNHQSIHLAAYFLANLYEKAIPGVTEEMVSAEEEHPTPRHFSDAFIELKYRQYKDLFDQIGTTHPTLKPQIGMYLYLVTPEVLRQRLEPFFQENVAVECFLKTYSAPNIDPHIASTPKAPSKESLTAVGIFIPTGCTLLGQLAALKSLTEDQKESLLKKSFALEAGVISSYIVAQAKKTIDIPPLLSPIEHRRIGHDICYAIQERCSQKTALLFSRYHPDINSFFITIGSPTTFLYLATMNGDLERINVLLSMGANPFAKTTYTITKPSGEILDLTTSSPYELAKKLSYAPHTHIIRRPFFAACLEMTMKDGKPAGITQKFDVDGNPLFEQQEYECAQELRGDDDHAFDQKLHALYQEIIKRFDEETARRKAPVTPLLTVCPPETNARPDSIPHPISPLVSRSHDYPEQAIVGTEAGSSPKEEWEATKDPGAIDSAPHATGSSGTKYIKNTPESHSPAQGEKERCCCSLV